MTTDRSTPREDDDEPPGDEFDAFLNTLNELKSTGCNLLVVGDAPREVFTRASSQLLGDSDILRYRVLAVTDATTRSVADRLPDPETAPRPLAETTRILNHAGVPRSVTDESAAPPELAGIRETCVADPQLRGLQSCLAEAIQEVVDSAESLNPADLRVGVDSLTPLVEYHGADVVRRCLDMVGGHVRDNDAMAHYVLPGGYRSERVQSVVPAADAVIELRTVDPDEYDHDVQQRWHVPDRDLATGWTPL
ncbi:hypothetical protein M0R89_19375 (plasmid) [Halorussus limi]|uniref:Uncharacterized protein n=1 Tax=Halorussus limi TaxID=2938695 RepID=A0A8U0I064_9EURY|nr:hypothetical protein [Halorussus limi]UPV76326.1 hypothetical protein M0R89_19375 [Halorussus limi]